MAGTALLPLSRGPLSMRDLRSFVEMKRKARAESLGFSTADPEGEDEWTLSAFDEARRGRHAPGAQEASGRFEGCLRGLHVERFRAFGRVFQVFLGELPSVGHDANQDALRAWPLRARGDAPRSGCHSALDCARGSAV